MSELVNTISVILITSSILMLLLNRLSHPSIPAYILSGFVLTTYLSGTINEGQMIGFAQLGIMFLVFLFGLKVEPERLSSVATESSKTALVITLITGFGSYILGLILGLNVLNAIYFSIAASISSSLIGLKLMEKDLKADLLYSRLSESIHLIQDILAIMFIIVTGAIESQNLIAGLFTGSILIFIALFIRAYLIDHIAKLAGRSQELTMLMALSFLTGFVAVTQIIGISNVIGAFAAGLALAKFPYNTESFDTIKPLKDFFSVVFFVSLGALVKIPDLGTLILTAILLMATLILKPLLTAFYLIHLGYDHRTAYLTGFSLDQISEFALMIGITAFVEGTMINPLFNALVIAAVITMIISSYTNRYEEEIYARITERFKVEGNNRKIEVHTDVGDLEDHIIVVGYGTQGQHIARKLKEQGEDVLVIENDPEKVSEAKRELDNYIFGDAIDLKTWVKAKSGKASLIISTVPSHNLSEKILHIDTSADKILRTQDVDEAADLMEKGAFFVEVPDLIASEELVEHIRRAHEDPDYKHHLRRKNLLELRKNQDFQN